MDTGPKYRMMTL